MRIVFFKPISVVFAILAILTLSAIGPGAARADDSADVLVQHGLELRRAGKPTQALEMFHRAHEAAPSARTLGQMGLVETSLQRWLDADGHLRAALATPDDPWVRKNRPFLAQALERTGAHVGELVIAGPPGAQVSFGGRPLGKLPLDGPVRAPSGNFLLVAAAPGQKTYATEVEIRGSGRVAVTITFDPLTTDVGPPTVVDDQPRVSAAVPEHRLRTAAGVSLIGAGGALLVWGATWVALDDSDACGGSSCQAVYATRRPGWLLVGTGALATAAGVAILVYPHRGGPGADADLALDVSPRGLSIGGRF